MPGWRLVVAFAVAGAALLAGTHLPTAAAVYLGTTSNAGNSLTAQATFPTYPTAVAADETTDWAYHRGDDAVSSAATSAAADSATGGARPGTYSGATNGPTTWWKLDESAGSAAGDASGAVNTGTLGSGATWTTTASHAGGRALSFDGTANAYVDGAAPSVDTTQSFTVSAWVYATATSGFPVAVGQNGAGANDKYAYDLWYDQPQGQWAFNMTHDANDTNRSRASVGGAQTNVWTHLVGVFDQPAGKIKLFVNGTTPATSNHATTWSATGTTQLGRDKWPNWGNNWQGMIDDVRIYRRALSGAEVTALYRGTNTPTVQWNLDEGSGTATADAGGGANATLSNSAMWNTGGITGNCLFFASASSRYLNGGSAALNTSQSFTVSAWVWANTTSGWKTIVSQNGTNSMAFELARNGTSWAFGMTPADAAANEQVLPAAGTVDTWAHLVAVFDQPANQMKLYVNGGSPVSVTRTSGLTWNATGTTQLGRQLWNGSWNYYFDGWIDDLRTYQRVLSAAEISALHGGGSEARLQWDINDSASPTRDASGNANPGTVTGATWTTAAGTHHSGGKALSFNGTTGNYVTSYLAPIATDQDYTVSAWVKFNSFGAGNQTVLSQTGVRSSGFFLMYNGSSGKYALVATQADTDNPTRDSTYSTLASATGQWVHLVGVASRTNNTITVYANGGNSATVAHSTWANLGGPTKVGGSKWNGASADPVNGYIDDVRVYQRALSAAEVTDLYNDRVPTSATNSTGVAPMTAGVRGALQGAQQGQQASTAVAFGGTTNAYNNTTQNNPTAFTLECWFKASGAQGGALIGFSSTATGTPVDYDRLLYLDSGGKLTFGAYTGTETTIRSPNAYNDGQWHHVAASIGAAGMKLYVDGALVATSANTSSENYTGYWRWGGTNLSGWPNRPSNDYLTGTLDEVAIYSSQLADQNIAWHYHANH